MLFLDAVRNQILNRKKNFWYLLEFLKRRPKVHQENTLEERNLGFDQRKIFSKNYKPIKIFACKITDNNC